VIIGRPAFSRDENGRIVPGVVPGFGPRFYIDEAGLVIGTTVQSDGKVRNRVALCDTDDLRDNLNRLADAIKATDDERRAMFEAFVKTVAHDMRAIVHPDDPLSTVQRKL